MTPFENIKLLYIQLMNLTDEIKALNVQGEYNEATSKLKSKDALIAKFLIARNSLNLTPEQKAELEVLAKDLRRKELDNIEHLTSLQKEFTGELKKINNVLKINKKYDTTPDRSGSMIDLIE